LEKPNKLWFLAPTIILLLAVLPLPYGFYQFLRIAVAVSSGFIAFTAFSNSKHGWAISFGAVCILFNPLIPVHLSKGVWAPIDVAVAVFFLIGWKFMTVDSKHG
jgi:hypothetical protein